jgi:hypothetical protein
MRVCIGGYTYRSAVQPDLLMTAAPTEPTTSRRSCFLPSVQVGQLSQRLYATQSLLAGQVGLNSMAAHLCNAFAFYHASHVVGALAESISIQENEGRVSAAAAPTFRCRTNAGQCSPLQQASMSICAKQQQTPYMLSTNPERFLATRLVHGGGYTSPRVMRELCETRPTQRQRQ